jgi:hypothetical protein
MPHPMTHGLYEQHSDLQMRGAAAEVDLIRRAAADVTTESSIAIADYGCAQGRVSTELLVRSVVAEIRSSDPRVPIFVYHNDLLSNDWSAMLGRLRASDSYLHTPGGSITPLVSATSFFEPVTPTGVVQLGLSFAAAQWLAEPGPHDAGAALYFDQLEGAARDEMAAQAAADWRRFLERRRDELAIGGRLLVNVMGTVEGEPAAGHDLWNIVRDVCGQFVADGTIDRARRDRYVIPVYERSVEEIRRPFDEAADRLGLDLEELEVRAVENPAAERFRSDGDAAAYAAGIAAFFRAWSEPSLRAALGLDDRLADQLYAEVEARISADADDFTFGLHTITALAVKAA